MTDVGQLVSRATTRFAGRVALDGPDGRLTYGELGDRVRRLANGLRASGLQPGDRILDLQTNQNSYVETDLAIRSAGLVRVALNHRLHSDDWTRIADDSTAAALIYDARFTAETEGLRSGLKGRTVVIGDGPGTPYERLIADASAARIPPFEPDALCGLHYSSGTTGHPKGARRTHRNWFASVVNMTYDVLGSRPGPEHAFLHAGPVTHTSGLFVLPFLVAGARQIVLPTWDVDAFVDAVENRGATHTALVPTMVARLLADQSLDRGRLGGLRMLGYAGAPMAPDQIRQAHDRLTPNLVQYYGLVEAIPPVTVLDAADHERGLAGEPELLGSAGAPALGVELAIVDDEARPVTADEVGEVVTRGDHVMQGYWNAEGRSDLSKALVDGWLHTGDLGRLDDQGRLYLVDRKGDMIISGGYNIYPREVEDVIAEIAGVAEVAVVGVDDPEWGQRVAAVYSVRAGAHVDDEQVLEHCKARLSSYKKPKQVMRVDRFPLSSTGKIAKRELRAQLSADPVTRP